MVDDEFEKLREKLEQFKKTHTKVVMKGRRDLIKRQYEMFTLEFEGKAEHEISEDNEGIDIVLKAKSFLSCEDGGFSLNTLMGLASFSQIDIVDKKIVFLMWFRCWDWV